MSSLLAIDLAIYERLVGAPLDSNGRPKLDANGIPVNRSIVAAASHVTPRLPSYGVRLPAIRQGVDGSRGATGHNVAPLHPVKDFRYVAPRQVPVFPLNVEGRDWRVIFPCVAFYWYETDFDPSTFIYDDPFCSVDPSAPIVSSQEAPAGQITQGSTRNKFSNHPDAYTETYIIRVWAKSLHEIKLLVSEIRRIFPARGVLEVERASGGKMPLDMILDRIENLDTNGPDVPMSQNSAEDRFFSRAFVYRVESYEDLDGGFDSVGPGCTANVSQAQWFDGTIQQRILELADAQDNLQSGDWYRQLDLAF